MALDRKQIEQVLMSDNVFEQFSEMHKSGILKEELPELDATYDCGQNNKNHQYTVFEHTMRAIEASEKDPILRWALLFHDLGKVETKTINKEGQDAFYGHPKKSSELTHSIMGRFDFSDEEKDTIERVVKHHEDFLNIKPDPNAKDPEKNRKNVKKNAENFIQNVGEKNLPTIIRLRRADIKAQSAEKQKENRNELIASLKWIGSAFKESRGKDLMVEER
ncbi:MAG: HD domain-containing protein [Ignavibacteriales bacterium]